MTLIPCDRLLATAYRVEDVRQRRAPVRSRTHQRKCALYRRRSLAIEVTDDCVGESGRTTGIIGVGLGRGGGCAPCCHAVPPLAMALRGDSQQHRAPRGRRSRRDALKRQRARAQVARELAAHRRGIWKPYLAEHRFQRLTLVATEIRPSSSVERSPERTRSHAGSQRGGRATRMNLGDPAQSTAAERFRVRSPYLVGGRGARALIESGAECLNRDRARGIGRKGPPQILVLRFGLLEHVVPTRGFDVRFGPDPGRSRFGIPR